MKGVFTLCLALGLALALAFELQPHSGECLVRHVHPINAPAELYLLAYITMQQSRDSPFMFGISFSPDPNEHYKTRDALALNNTHIVHHKVREGESSHRAYRLPVRIPNGWTTLKVMATARNITLQFWENSWVYVTNQALDHDILELYFEEAVALCSGQPALAAWEVYGTEFTMQLQPLSRQWIEVMAEASATPYFKFPGETDKHSIPPNTTMQVFNSHPWRQYTTIVSKDGEELARSNASSDVPKNLIVGGASHVRLSLSPPPIPADPPTSRPSGTPGLTAGTVVVVVVAVVAVLAVAAAVTRFQYGTELKGMFRKKTNKDTEAHHDNPNAEVFPLTQNTEGVCEATRA